MSSAEQKVEEAQHPKLLEVTVTFPLGHGDPFHKEEQPTTTVGAVLAEAMAHFGVTPQPGSSYYLTHDGARIDDGRTLAEVAGQAHAVKFTLVKELVQG